MLKVQLLELPTKFFNDREYGQIDINRAEA